MDKVISLSQAITEHCELMIEQAKDRMNRRWNGAYFDEMPYDEYVELVGDDPYEEEARDQGIKDACRIILLVVKDYE